MKNSLYEYEELGVYSTGKSIRVRVQHQEVCLPHTEAKKLLFILLKELDEQDQIFISDLDQIIKEIAGFSLSIVISFNQYCSARPCIM